jgi:hypothetical protein
MRMNRLISAKNLLTSGLGLIAVASSAQAAENFEPPTYVTPTAWAIAPISERWSATFASAARYYSWVSTRGVPANVNENRGSGSQVYIPYALQVVGQPSDDIRIEMLGRAGWVGSRQSTLGLNGEVQTFTDTLASGTVTYLGLGGIQPFVSLNLNIPTGRSALFGKAANARMDPDLVEIGSFGEGWNVGPSIGANVALSENLIATIAAGQTWRSAFERENSLVTTSNYRDNQRVTAVDPGDVSSLTGSIAYRRGPWSMKVYGAVSSETITRENGAPLYRPGMSYSAGMSADYAWRDGLGVSTITANYSRSGPNDVKFLGRDDLVVEPFNMNSNQYRAGFQHLWSAGNLWFGPVGSILFRDRNGYESRTLQFVPAKQGYSAGVVALWGQANGLSFDFRAEHAWLREGATSAINGQMYSVLANGYVLNEAAPTLSSRGWRFSGGLNFKF